MKDHADVGPFTLDLTRYHAFLDRIVADSGPMLKDSSAFDGRPPTVGFSLLFDEMWKENVVQPPAGFSAAKVHVVSLLGWRERVLVIMSDSGHRAASDWLELDGLDAISLSDADGRQKLLEHIGSALDVPTFLLPLAAMFPVDEWEDNSEEEETERCFGRYEVRVALVGEWSDEVAARQSAERVLWNLATSPAWPVPEVVSIEDCSWKAKDADAFCRATVRVAILMAPDGGDARDRLQEFFEAARENELICEYAIVDIKRRRGAARECA
jgi:hypothetical protein